MSPVHTSTSLLTTSLRMSSTRSLNMERSGKMRPGNEKQLCEGGGAHDRADSVLHPLYVMFLKPLSLQQCLAEISKTNFV